MLSWCPVGMVGAQWPRHGPLRGVGGGSSGSTKKMSQKQIKEAFVRNHSGASVLEVSQLGLPALWVLGRGLMVVLSQHLCCSGELNSSLTLFSQ